MSYFSNNLQKLLSTGGSPPQRPLIFDFGDLKLRDLAKLCFFEQIMAKSNFEKISYDDVSVTSSLIRHRTRHETKVIRFFHFGPLPIKISGYASVLDRLQNSLIIIIITIIIENIVHYYAELL